MTIASPSLPNGGKRCGLAVAPHGAALWYVEPSRDEEIAEDIDRAGGFFASNTMAMLRSSFGGRLTQRL